VGYLYPLGHRVGLIKLTERRFSSARIRLKGAEQPPFYPHLRQAIYQFGDRASFVKLTERRSFSSTIQQPPTGIQSPLRPDFSGTKPLKNFNFSNLGSLTVLAQRTSAFLLLINRVRSVQTPEVRTP
jgi:hypothetical protein